MAEVEDGCSRPCSYSTRDISFETSWPSPIHPTTMCMPRDSILGVRLTCRYRPHLNENGRVQFIAHSVLTSLGALIACTSYSRYVITKDFILEDCTSRSRTEIPQTILLPGTAVTRNIPKLPTTTRGILKSTPSPSVGEGPSSTVLTHKSSDTIVHVSPTSAQVATILSHKPEAMSHFTSPNLPTKTSTYDSHFIVPMAPNTSSISSSTLPSSTVSGPPEVPTEHNKTGGSIDYLMAVLIGLLVVSLVLLFLCLLAAAILYARRRRKKKSHLQGGANLSTRYTIESMAVSLSSSALTPGVHIIGLLLS